MTPTGSSHPTSPPTSPPRSRISRLTVLKDIGHTAMMEDPVTTARAMLALLEDAPRSEG